MKHLVGARQDINPGTLLRVRAGSVDVCVAQTAAGGWYAISNVCSHEDFPLSAGDLDGEYVECVKHGSRFSLSTGEPDALPAVRPVGTYPVTFDGEHVYVEVPES